MRKKRLQNYQNLLSLFLPFQKLIAFNIVVMDICENLPLNNLNVSSKNKKQVKQKKTTQKKLVTILKGLNGTKIFSNKILVFFQNILPAVYSQRVIKTIDKCVICFTKNYIEFYFSPPNHYIDEHNFSLDNSWIIYRCNTTNMFSNIYLLGNDKEDRGKIWLEFDISAFMFQCRHILANINMDDQHLVHSQTNRTLTRQNPKNSDLTEIDTTAIKNYRDEGIQNNIRRVNQGRAINDKKLDFKFNEEDACVGEEEENAAILPNELSKTGHKIEDKSSEEKSSSNNDDKVTIFKMHLTMKRPVTEENVYPPFLKIETYQNNIFWAPCTLLKYNKGSLSSSKNQASFDDLQSNVTEGATERDITFYNKLPDLRVLFVPTDRDLLEATTQEPERQRTNNSDSSSDTDESNDATTKKYLKQLMNPDLTYPPIKYYWKHSYFDVFEELINKLRKRGLIRNSTKISSSRVPKVLFIFSKNPNIILCKYLNSDSSENFFHWQAHIGLNKGQRLFTTESKSEEGKWDVNHPDFYKDFTIVKPKNEFSLEPGKGAAFGN